VEPYEDPLEVAEAEAAIGVALGGRKVECPESEVCGSARVEAELHCAFPGGENGAGPGSQFDDKEPSD
jgi:hypothetical protein